MNRACRGDTCLLWRRLTSRSGVARAAARASVVVLTTWIASAPAATSQLPSGASRLHVSGVECSNLTTGGTVRSTDAATEWDCVALGLSAEQGDRIGTSVRGRVPQAGVGERPQAVLSLSSIAPLLLESEVSDHGNGELDTADFDLDGDPDLVLEEDFRWIEHVDEDPPVFVEHPLDGPWVNALGVLALDVDGDERPDIVASFGQSAELIAWYQNLPTDPPTFRHRLLYKEAGWRPWKLRGADLDGDGDQDILSWNIQNPGGDVQRLVWHENGGTGVSFTSQVLYEVEASFASIRFEVGDLDGDVDIDIFATVESDVEMFWLENAGQPDPSFEFHLVDDEFVPSGVPLADFDRDGDLDVAAGFDVNFGAFAELRIYENVDGQFDQLQVHSLGFFDTGLTPVVGDLNSDGWPDLFLPASSITAQHFLWLENRGSLAFVQHTARNVDEMVPKIFPIAVDLGVDGRLDLVGETGSVVLDGIVRVEARMTVGGWSSALAIDRVRCRNLTTGQTVSSSGPMGNSFDCEAIGLIVGPGDVVQTMARGIVTED